MGCREFDPGIEKFCADPTDFKGAGQIIQMATFFGIKGMELKKIKVIAAREEQARIETSHAQIDSLNADRREKDESTIEGFDSDELLNEPR
jgi:hypothetical protein